MQGSSDRRRKFPFDLTTIGIGVVKKSARRFPKRPDSHNLASSFHPVSLGSCNSVLVKSGRPFSDARPAYAMATFKRQGTLWQIQLPCWSL